MEIKRCFVLGCNKLLPKNRSFLCDDHISKGRTKKSDPTAVDGPGGNPSDRMWMTKGVESRRNIPAGALRGMAAMAERAGYPRLPVPGGYIKEGKENWDLLLNNVPPYWSEIVKSLESLERGELNES